MRFENLIKNSLIDIMATPAPKKARPLSFSVEMMESSHQIEEQHSHSQPPSLSMTMQPAASTAPSPTKRIRGVILRKSIVYGNITHRMSKNEVIAMRAAANTVHCNDIHEMGHSRRNRNNHNTAASLDGSESWYRWTVYGVFP